MRNESLIILKAFSMGEMGNILEAFPQRYDNTPESQEEAENLKKLKKKLDEAMANKENLLEVYDKVVDFANALEVRYSREVCRECLLFHLLIFSGPPDNWKHYDFPGEYSIEKFIEGL